MHNQRRKKVNTENGLDERRHAESACTVWRGENRLKCVAVATIILGFALGAQAETIMYNGFPLNGDATYFKGFTIAESNSKMWPTGLSNMMRNPVRNSTLTFPECFSESSKILPVMGGANDASLYVTDTNKTDGGIFDQWTNVSGAKILKLLDNCQSRTGSLHFRVLMKAEQGVLDSLVSDHNVVPTLANSQTCGIFWTVPDYFEGCGNNGNLRLNGGLNLSATDNIANASGLTYNFLRGLAFSFFKNSTGVVSLKLFAWGSETADLNSVQTITLVDNVQADETYVCYARVDIGANDTRDVICGMAQPVSTYDRSAVWSGSPFPLAIRSNLIGGNASFGLNANFLVMGSNKYAGKMQVDEACLTTSAEEAVVFDAANVGVGVVIANDGFPCGTGGYSTEKKNVGLSAVLPTTSAVYGFENASWTQAMNKNVPKTFGVGHGLSFPVIYADCGIRSTDGTSIGWEDKYSQAMMVYRTLSNGLLNLSEGETLNMRFLISVTATAVSNLATGPDTCGTLMAGTIGQKANVNYVGAGLLSLPDTKIETNDSEAPALCQRDNSCLFAVVKGADGKVGLYLNLRSTASSEPTSYKLANVGEAGGTYLCFATIEIGTGAGGTERIRAFGINIGDVKDQHVQNWVPEGPNENAIECELVNSASASYPKQLAVGGSVCGDSFMFDEFALSVGSWYPLVWARFPRLGFRVMFR